MASLADLLSRLTLVRERYNQLKLSSVGITYEEDAGEYAAILLFYETLLGDMLNKYFIDRSAIQVNILRIKSIYGKTANGKTPEDIDYNDISNCFAYLHRYAACQASLVRNVLKQVFHSSSPEAITRISTLSSLNVVSLGGGPGNDLVGFCSALYGKDFGLLQMNMTIVDNMIGWKEIFFGTEKMLRDQNFGDASEFFKGVGITTSFMQADLANPNSWSTDLEIKLENADIFLMVKVLSVIPDCEKIKVLQGIVSMMKPGALLIFIDSPFRKTQFSTLEQWLQCVYERGCKRFLFKHKTQYWDHRSITSSQAYVRIYERKKYIF